MSNLWRKLNRSRWDSSDPERAPPPLPLNPQSPVAATSRAGTSAAIQSAHAALTEKARENALVPHSMTKRNSDMSPERPERSGRSLGKSAAHRRMQSLQPGSVKDMSLMLEGGPLCKSPDKADRDRPSLPATPSRSKTDYFTDNRSDEQERDREQRLSLTPAGASLTPVIRPTPRRPQSSILGENTPPQSATMLALQNMSTPRDSPREREPEAPLANVTNGSTAVARTPQSLDLLSNQIITLTNIATSLQKEMSQLSRRSRDNATDLLSLKEATNTRDEDIRKNLRDLLHNMQDVQSRTISAASRDIYGGPLLLENKPYASSLASSKSGSNSRPFALPRIPSPNSFAASLDRDEIGTPSLFGAETPSTIGMLEKIIRDMGTKQGQDQLLSRLSDLADKLNGSNVEKKVEDLQRLVKDNMDQSVVLADAGSGGGGGKVRHPMTEGFDEDPEDYRNDSLEARVERLMVDKDAHQLSAPTARAAADLISDDIVKIIRTVKDSVAQGGGLTAEVKALVRELRGEVLGMGREIGRRLDETAETSQSKTTAATKVEINRVVEEGLMEMKEHMNQVMRDHRRQTAAALVANKPSEVDYHEIYNATRTALKDSKVALQKDAPELQREDVLEAVREAWENYKPEIEVQQIGLERDEVLACLKEGLTQYAPKDDKEPGATRDEVFTAVVEGMKHFNPPPIEIPATLSRDEIIEAVRDCLEEFEFPVAPSAIGAEVSKQDMIDAVKEGLETLDLPAKDNAPLVPYQANNDEILVRLHEIMEFVQAEFKAVSDEAKQNVAANGRDTEQVLDATKDGFERLRADIEGYVDRAAGVSSQEEFMEDLLKSLDVFREEIANMVAQQADGSRDLIKDELESLRETVNTSLVPAAPQPSQGNHEEVLQALQEGLGSLRHEISQRPVAGTSEVLDALQEGLSDLRNSIDKLNDKPADLSANDEILEALKEGLDGVKSDIEGLREESKALTTVDSTAMVAADMLKHDDIKNLEVLISQLRIKLEAMEVPPPAASTAADPAPSLGKDDLALMEEMLHTIKVQVEEIANKEPAPIPREAAASTDAATKEDVEAIETILRNTKARLEELTDGEQAVRKDHIDALEVLILETKESLGGLTEQLEQLSHRDDTKAVESLVTQVIGGFDEMKERHEKQLEDPEKVTKTDTDAIEAVCLDVKTVVEQMVKSDIAALPSKEDLERLESLVKEFKEISDKQTAEVKETTEKLATELKEAAEKHATEIKEVADKHAEDNAKQFEERQAETVGVGERVTEVKVFLEEMQTLVKEKLENGITGVEGLGSTLGTLGETIGQNANVHADLKEMFEAMKTEFEESKAGVVGAKLETDEKFEQTTETLRSKIDERIDEVILKYEEFQAVMDERNKTGEARDEVLEGTVVGTKAVAEELKSLIDTLGSTVTESLEKMEEASKTVFTRVEDIVLRSDDNHTENKSEHAQTRDQVKEAMGTFEGLQGQVNEYQPKILEAVQSVLEQVGLHFEHSKLSATEIEEKISQKIEEAKPEPLLLPPPPEKYDDAQVHEKLDRLVDQKYDDAQVHEKLDKLVEQKYDDAQVHEKLDRLVDHTQSADKAFEQLSTLDKVHQQVMETAAELAAFLAAQTRRNADDQEERERRMKDMDANLHETTVELERCTVQRDHVEATVASLQAEEERLRQSIVGLKVEQESLVRQKVKLTGDVSSLETALDIRREELHEMEHRAEVLERRILEGVMDQSRLLLMAKSSKKSARDVMSRKRAPKPLVDDDGAQTESGQVTPKAQLHTVALKTALNSNRNNLHPQKAVNGQQQQARRILSLSQINKPGLSATPNPSTTFKRSQSVKTLGGAGAFRKSSWGGRMNGKKSYGELGDGDKENVNLNVVALRECDEEGLDESEHGGEVVLANPDLATPTDSVVSEDMHQDYTDEEGRSEAETLRRSSIHSGTGTVAESDLNSGSYTGAESDMQLGSYGPGSDGIESTYGPESDTQSTYGPESELQSGSYGPESDLQSGSYGPESDLQSGSYTGSEEDDDDRPYSDYGSEWTESNVGSSVVTGADHAPGEGGQVMVYEG